jgi:hypothetical protein
MDAPKQDDPAPPAPPPSERTGSEAEPEAPESEDPPANPFGLVPVLILLVVVAVGFFVAFRLRDVSTLQDCVMSGRKNCAPVDTSEMK